MDVDQWAANAVRVTMKAGEEIDLTLPSGKVVNIEVTADTASVVIGSRVVFNENLVISDDLPRGRLWMVDNPLDLDGLND